ncbi:MAG TPA: class II aldolase/adducin family protein [Verrucomicrobiae bacterium]|nr:class II aldolase/adducin family protein [Verrucomicrobiae bacterium]
MRSEHQLRKDICEVGRRLYQKGMIAAADGNISVRMENGHLLVTPSGRNKGRLDEEDLVVTDADGRKLYGKLEPSSEIVMHLVAYRERADVCAVVHAHPPHATGFAVAGVPLDQPLISEVVLTLGTIPLAEYGTPTTPELAAAIEPYVRDHDAILLANHGAMASGRDVFSAYDRMETLEHFAHIWMVARILGEERPLSAENVAKLEAIRRRAHFEPRAQACFTCPVLEEKIGGKDPEKIHVTRDQLVELVADVVKGLTGAS